MVSVPLLKIKLFTFFYNEAFLIPFYLNHYWWADQIHAIVSQSSDNTRHLLAADPRVHIEDFEFPDGIDDVLKINHLNSRVEACSQGFDWVMVPDADEFYWPRGHVSGDPRQLLQVVGNEYTAHRACMWHVFRHRTDADLDPRNPRVVQQRRHGISDRTCDRSIHYQKPSIIRPGHGIRFGVGQHTLDDNPAIKFSPYAFDGAHWQNADPCFAVIRTCRDRRDHMSKANLERGHGWDKHSVKEQEVMDLCAAHLDDSICF